MPGTRPRYTISTRTSHDHINVHFPQHQPNSHLDLEATTSNGAASVQLHPSYEGIYEISTSSHYEADVTYKDVQDPAGLGRKRKFEQKYIRRGRAAGHVGWGNDFDGSVVVRTSNAQNVLSLQ